jgi:hypothetical protein
MPKQTETTKRKKSSEELGAGRDKPVMRGLFALVAFDEALDEQKAKRPRKARKDKAKEPSP